MPSENSCIHCGSVCGKTPIVWNDHFFCCHGCQQVYQLLNEHKLQQYYTLTDLPGIKVENAGHITKYEFLDKDEVRQKLYSFYENHLAKVTFYIPSIHCTSCIWLLEHLNKLHIGVKQASVNFVQKNYTVTFDTRELSLRQLVELLVSIHYIPEISLQSLEANEQKHENKALIYKIGVAGFIAGNVMLFSLPLYFNGKPLEGALGLFFSYVSFILTVPLVFYCGSDYLISAWKGVRNKMVNIDLPIALGVITLFVVTCYEVISKTGQGYSDSLSGLLFFLLLGKWYQSKTYQALSFDRDYKSYFPVAVTKVTDEGEESLLLKEIQVGDILMIRNKELIPADSVLVTGLALVDYSFVSGESTPIRKEIGDPLYAGGIQVQGAITIRVIREVSQSQLTQLWNQSEMKRPAAKYLLPVIDRMSIFFTLAIISIAIAGFCYYWFQGYFNTAILVFTSVLIVTCPCALALSLPFTLGNSMRILGIKGVYLKNTHAIEKLTKVDTLVFDKTGTITVPDESNVTYQGRTLAFDEIQAIASLARQSTHPLSQAIAKHFTGIETFAITGFVEVAGKGVFAHAGNLKVKLGSASYVNHPMAIASDVSTVVYVEINNICCGYFAIGNKYREGFANVMSDLKKHFKLYLLSGDNTSEWKTLRAYFSEDELFFNQKPQDKMDFIKALQDQGRNVLMTGDGLNDAGAFMQSNVAVSVADDIYHFSPAGDIIIEAGKFRTLYQTIRFARKSLLIVKMSFAISFLYNVLGLIYALSGTMSPVVAAILMPVSSVTVVAFAIFGTQVAGKWVLKEG